MELNPVTRFARAGPIEPCLRVLQKLPCTNSASHRINQSADKDNRFSEKKDHRKYQIISYDAIQKISYKSDYYSIEC